MRMELSGGTGPRNIFQRRRVVCARDRLRIWNELTGLFLCFYFVLFVSVSLVLRHLDIFFVYDRRVVENVDGIARHSSTRQTSHRHHPVDALKSPLSIGYNKLFGLASKASVGCAVGIYIYIFSK